MHDVLHMVTRYFFSISLIVNSITIQLCGSKLSSTCHMMHHMSLFFFFLSESISFGGTLLE